MINLLPAEEKQKIVYRRQKKTAVIVWFFLVFFAVCLIAVLLSVRAIISNKTSAEERIYSGLERKYEESETKAINKEINNFNSSVSKLDAFWKNKIYFSDIIARFAAIVPDGVYFNDLSLTPSVQAEGPSYLSASVTGIAPTRESLFNLKKNLEKDGFFQQVSFPPANWVKATDINFTISFKIDSNGSK